MARLNVAAAGNAEENINLINARFQAEALRRLRGKDCGVLDNSFYSSAHPTGLQRDTNGSFMWPLTANTLTDGITVGRGMATAYGYDIQSESDVNFTNLTAPSAGTKYFFVYLEWDLSNPVEANGKIDIHDNGGGATWTPPYQDNLITNPLGKYQMPLHRIAVNTAGNVIGTLSWKALSVDTINDVLRAENAGHAENADYAEYPKDDTTKISEHFNSIYTRLAELGFREGVANVKNAYAVSRNSLKRLGYFVVFFLTATHQTNWSGVSNADINIEIPAGFRPETDTDVEFFVLGESGGAHMYRKKTFKVKADGSLTIPYKDPDADGNTSIDNLYNVIAAPAFWQIKDIPTE